MLSRLFCGRLLVALAMLGCAVASGAAAQPVVRVDGSSDKVPLVPRAVVIDPAGTLTMEEARRRLTAPDVDVETGVFSHGYVPDTLWGRIVLEVEPAAAGRWYLSLELPNFDRLQVYTVPEPDGPAVPLVELGDRVPEPSEIRTRFHVAPIDLPAGRAVLLVRGRTDSTLTVDLKLRKLDTLLLEEQSYFALQSFYLGVAVIFALSALGLFVQTLQAIYLIYVVNLVAHSVLWLLINGTGPGHLWPEVARSFHMDPHPFVALTLYGTAAFAASFLSTTRVPVAVCWGLHAMAALGLALTVLCLVMPEGLIYWSSRLVSTVVLPAVGGLFALTGIGLYRGEPAARPLMLTWAGLILAVVFALMRDIGLVPSNTFTLTGAQLGSVFEMVVFAYMLIARLGQLQREKEEIQAQALAAAREQEAVLEQRVADRTVELDAAVERERGARRLQQQFVAMVGHEFRTPLAIIDGAAQNIAVLEPGSRSRVDKIRTAVRRLLRMIDTCLIDERVEGGTIQLQAETFDLRDLADEAVDAVRAAAPDREYVMRMPDTPVMIHADIRLTEIAVGNLLDNAVKYSPAGSAIGVTVRAVPEGIEMTVEDDGPGVPEAERERIFEKYHRAGNTAGTPGAGLGLHLVRTILETHGGSVRYEPRASGGSAFVLRFGAELPGDRAVAE